VTYCQGEHELDEDLLECDRQAHDQAEAHRTRDLWWFDSAEPGSPLDRNTPPPSLDRLP